MTPEEKRKFELRLVEELNEATRLGLTDLRNADLDPPDVVGMMGGRRIGIEVTEPIESADAKTHSLLNLVLMPAVEKRAARAAPGQALISTHNVTLAEVEHVELMDLADALAGIVLQLAAVATTPDSCASAANGSMQGSIGRRVDWNLQQGISLPTGFDFVSFTRLQSGAGVKVVWIGGQLPPIMGAGLETTEELIKKKSVDLARWTSGFEEKWLLIASLRHSRTSAQQARFDRQRFPHTGFDRIYLVPRHRGFDRFAQHGQSLGGDK